MRTLAFLVLSLLAATATAQRASDRVVPSTVSTTGTVNIQLEGAQGVGVLVDGTCTGLQWTPQVSVNGTVWTNARAYDVANNAVVTSAIGEGNFVIFPTSGMMSARVNITALTATCDFTLRATASGQDPGGSSVAVIQWGGTAVAGGSGTATAGSPRVVLATDVPLPAGTNAIGTVTANQTAATEQGHPRAPSPDGAALQLTCTTASSTIATLTGDAEYWMGITGASAMVIFGGTAALTTGFTVPEGFVALVRAEGVNAACITAAGTGTLTFTPVTYE